MIIPVRCVTCGALISDKFERYTEIVAKNRKDVKEIELLDADILNVPENTNPPMRL